jgi:hypothetical protein
MDEIVEKAMARWPNVPDCYGWLGLDARGDWYLRDDAAQAAGPFPLGRGAVLRHAQLLTFIERNYAPTEDGSWFFQNGPQRVFVELEATPWIWRIGAGSVYDVVSHTGKLASEVRTAFTDEAGRLYLDTEIGVGLVHTQDMHLAADAIEASHWKLSDSVTAENLAVLYKFQRHPKALPAE